MNWDIVEGNWKKFKGQIKQKWGKFTDSDLDQLSGKKDELLGRLQNLYGMKRDDAERELDEFARGIDDRRAPSERL